MSKFRHALQNRDQHILTLRMICGVLVLCLFVAFAGWMRAPAKLTIHNPPDLRSGSTRAWWEVPLPTVYAFSFYIFQQLNASAERRRGGLSAKDCTAQCLSDAVLPGVF